jgi:hypothetical protein
MPLRFFAPAGRSAFARLWCGWWVLAVALSLRAADDPRPVVGPGATRDEVINAYGWPNGMSQSGTKEIFSYNQGNVTLENGRVESVNFRPNIPWQAPRPRPGPPTASTARKDAPPDHWLASFDEAAREAARRNARILALFTGSDWSPASQQFRDEVENNPEFVFSSVVGEFVLLRLDYPTRAPQPPEVRERNLQLRQKYHVTSYPTLLVLSPAGASLAQVDLAKPVAGDSYLVRVLAAVREVRDLLGAQAALAPPALAPAVEAPPAAPGDPAAKDHVLAAPLSSAGWLLTGGAAAGCGVAAFLFWLVWRRWSSGSAAPGVSMSHRIAEAASGVPATAEFNSWSKKKLRGVAAAVAESEGYAVEVRPEGGGIDLAFARAGDAQSRVLVCCLPAEEGIVSGKRMREFVGDLRREGATGGWCVAPAGFASEAKAHAEPHGIVLVDGRALLSLLGNLPPLILPRVLARVV